MRNLERTNLELYDAYEKTLEGWSKALILRDKETEGHSLRVTIMSEQLARRLHLEEAELVHLRRGALLSTTLASWACPMPYCASRGRSRRRSVVSWKCIQSLCPRLAGPSLLSETGSRIPVHHEKWDGTGYPRGSWAKGCPWRHALLPWRMCGMHFAPTALTGSPGTTIAVWPSCRQRAEPTFDPRVVAAFVALHAELGEAIDNLPEGEEGPIN